MNGQPTKPAFNFAYRQKAIGEYADDKPGNLGYAWDEERGFLEVVFVEDKGWVLEVRVQS